jgi:alpha-L-fucosidase
VTTQKEKTIYVHVLNWGAPMLALPPISGEIASAKSLIDQTPLTFTQNADGVVVKLPPTSQNETDRVIVLTLNK